MALPTVGGSVVTQGPSNTGGVGNWERTTPAINAPSGTMLLVYAYVDWGSVNCNVSLIQGGTCTFTQLQRVSVGNIGTAVVWVGYTSGGGLTDAKVRVTMDSGDNAYLLVTWTSGHSTAPIGVTAQYTTQSSSAMSMTVTPQAAESLVFGFGFAPFGPVAATLVSGMVTVDNTPSHMAADAVNWAGYRATTSTSPIVVGTSTPTEPRWGMIVVEVKSVTTGGGGSGTGGGTDTYGVGVTTEVEHMLPSYPKRNQNSASLAGCGNEFVSFQIAIYGPATVNGVTIPDFGPFKQNQNVRVYRVGWINLSRATGPDGFTGRAPDPLIPDVDDIVGEKRNAFPFTVPNGELWCLWVEFFIPKDTPAQYCNGTVQVNLSSGTASIPVSFKIWGFNIPATPTIRSFYRLTYPCLPAQHDCSTTAKYNTMASRYAQMALDHRFTLCGLDTGDSNINNFNAYFGPFCDGTGQYDSKSIGTRLGGARWTAIYGGSFGMGSTFINNCSSRGWLPRVVNYGSSLDEPGVVSNWSRIASELNRMHGVSTVVKNLVTTTLSAATSAGQQNNIEILCPVIDGLRTKSSDTRPSYSSWLSANGNREIWTYMSCDSWGCGGSSGGGWATFAIDFRDPLGHATGMATRQFGWICYNEKVNGHLYYETGLAYTTGDPWTNQFNYGGNGDGNLFYPGTTLKIGGSTEIPVASLRLKHLRSGMQDYEYLKILDGLGDSIGKQLALNIFPTTYGPRPDPPTFYATRLAIGNRIAALLGAEPQSGSPPSITSIEPSSGPPAGGGTVVISGEAFATGCTVRFGNVSAQVKSSSSTAISVTVPAATTAGAVGVTVTNPDGASYTFVDGYTYVVAVAPVAGPPLDAGWPVFAKATNSSVGSLDVVLPATGGPNRLLYATVTFNTRGNTNALPIGVTGLGLTWVPVVASDFLSITPGHEGADVFAAWAPSAVTAGDKVTVTFGAAVALDCLVTVYARSGTASGSANVLNCFGITSVKSDPTGAQATMNIAWPSPIAADSGAVVSIVNGSGTGGLTGQVNTRIDAQNRDFVSMASGSLISYAPETVPGTRPTSPPSNGTTLWAPAVTDTSWANVVTYGAVGDGVADDTAAFNAAFASGKKVFVPATDNFYLVTGNVNVTQSIYGDGSMPSIEGQQDGAGTTTIFKIAGKTTDPEIVIQGLTLDGGWDGYSSFGESSGLIDIRGSKNVRAQYNVLRKPYGDCVFVGGDGYAASSGIVIQNNSMMGPRRQCVRIQSANGCQVLSNTMKKSNSYQCPVNIEPTAWAGSGLYERADHVKVQGNTIYSGPQPCVSLLHEVVSDPAYASGGSDINISNNIGHNTVGFITVGPYVVFDAPVVTSPNKLTT